MTDRKNLLTRRQLRRMERLPPDHEVVSVQGRAPIVRQPDGRLLRIRPSGRVVDSMPVERVRSYLHLND
jgi:hypothetical protein